MLSFPAILIGVFGAAGLLLVVILLVVLLPRREPEEPSRLPDADDRLHVPPLSGRNGQGYSR